MDVRKIFFVGAGPGDPELLTLKAIKVLKTANLIIYPGSIISKDIISEFNGEKIDSYKKSLEEIVDIISKAVDDGKTVVRLQSGDPSIYSALDEQITELKKRDIDVEIIPGVSSVFASSAALKKELTIPGISQTVVITRPAGKTLDKDIIEELARLPITLVILLGIGLLEELVEKIRKNRGIVPVSVVYHASRVDQIIIDGDTEDIIDKVKSAGIKRTAVIIVWLEGNKKRSLLYRGEEKDED
ncbi:MAG: radical SAM protein [Candidatus Methanoliparum thermophilum]|uniref:Radical SAM protein n=1 Tax=Methanoliparum thermophilum TaxID=2491083 RepID=A0A520KRP2_METT2|nr:MAG: radical SAM protein [Candidatus Methanoliparum thermophilum]BDC35953.1 cobalt-precorrin-4 C(11)-methyltransferase [Candidatus Methanoliparum sp. LAM-1]